MDPVQAIGVDGSVMVRTASLTASGQNELFRPGVKLELIKGICRVFRSFYTCIAIKKSLKQGCKPLSGDIQDQNIRQFCGIHFGDAQ